MTEDCGCTSVPTEWFLEDGTKFGDGKPEIVYCSLHAAAPALLSALKKAETVVGTAFYVAALESLGPFAGQSDEINVIHQEVKDALALVDRESSNA